MTRTRAWAAALGLVVALGLVGCGGAPSASRTTGPSAPVGVTTPTASTSTYAGQVGDPHAQLVSVAVLRTDGFRVDRSYGTSSARAVHRLVPPARMPHVRALAGGPQVAAPSLSGDAGLRAVVSGGDGAGELPLEKVARSTDGGRHWSVLDIPTMHGARGDVSGQVVLPDGRLLVLLDHWSDDHGTLGRQWHGLWISRGTHLSPLRPWRPRFVPTPDAAPRGFSPLSSLDADTAYGGVVWTTTYGGALFVSTDGARTFRGIADR